MKCEDVIELERLRKENEELKFQINIQKEYNSKLEIVYETVKKELDVWRKKGRYITTPYQ